MKKTILYYLKLQLPHSANNLATVELIGEQLSNTFIHELLHEIDVILVVCELVVLLVMVLSFLGAGNVTANKVAHRWVNGSWAALFWVGMIGLGLVLPEILYVFAGGTLASSVVAPVLVLAGGCLLRFLVVYSDERAPLPGEDLFYEKLPDNKAPFIHKWTYGKNIF